jgi:signal transduction histidine kinase
MSEEARLQALTETGLLDAGPTAALDRFTRIAQRALGVPVVLVSLVDADRQFFTSALGLPSPWAERRETPLSHSFCKHVVRSGAPLIVENAPENPIVSDNLAIRDLGVRAYAGFPIVTEDDHVLGSFCAIDAAPRQWAERELAILQDIANAAGVEINLRRRLARLERAEIALSRMIDELHAGQELEAKVAATFRHDLRSPLQVLQLGIHALEKNSQLVQSPQVTRALELMKRSVSHAVSIVNLMKDPETLDGELVRVDGVIREVVSGHKDNGRGIDVTLGRIDPAPVQMDFTNMRRCVENLISNALRFAFSLIKVECMIANGIVVISVEDDGDGLPKESSYDEVWKSGATFHTDGRSGTGLGLNIIQSLVQQAGGSVSGCKSELGGARFEMKLPKAGS